MSVPPLFAALLRHKLLRNTLVYAGSGVAKNAIPFLMLPVLTRYLSPSDFGIVATFEVILAVALVGIGVNMYGAVAVNAFRLDRHELQAYVSNVILVSALAAVIAFFVAYALVDLVPLEGGTLVRWLPLIAIAGLSQVLFSIALTLWQVEESPVPYGLFQISQTALNVGLSLLFVINFRWGWEGRVKAILITSIVFGALSFAVVYARGFVRSALRTDYIWDALSFGIPLVPHSLGNWILTGIDRLFLASMIGVAATGVYTVGYQVGMIVGLLASSFNQAWSPFLFAKLKAGDPESKIRIVKFTYAYFPAILVMALLLSLVAPWLLSVFVGPEFRGADRFVFWVALGYAFNGMYLMVVNYIYHEKKTHLLAWITLLTGVVNVALNYVLISENGAIGAAQASAASFLVGFVLTWILSARVCRMPWRVWNVGVLEKFRTEAKTANA